MQLTCKGIVKEGWMWTRTREVGGGWVGGERDTASWELCCQLWQLPPSAALALWGTIVNTLTKKSTYDLLTKLQHNILYCILLHGWFFLPKHDWLTYSGGFAVEVELVLCDRHGPNSLAERLSLCEPHVHTHSPWTKSTAWHWHSGWEIKEQVFKRVKCCYILSSWFPPNCTTKTDD